MKSLQAIDLKEEASVIPLGSLIYSKSHIWKMWFLNTAQSTYLNC